MTDRIRPRPIYRHILEVTGNSFGVRIAKPLAVKYGFDYPTYVTVEGTERGILIKRIKEEALI
jgi:hypothetical protein